MPNHCTRGNYFIGHTCDGKMDLTPYYHGPPIDPGFKNRLRQYLLKNQEYSKGTVTFDESGNSAMITYDKPSE